jgi:hypothetical protein
MKPKYHYDQFISEPEDIVIMGQSPTKEEVEQFKKRMRDLETNKSSR